MDFDSRSPTARVHLETFLSSKLDPILAIDIKIIILNVCSTQFDFNSRRDIKMISAWDFYRFI